MMQECPRCGFLQPRDRYCAYCGLDIESFLTKPQPWYRRLLLSTTIQVGALGITVCATFGYIYWQQKGLPSFSEVLLRAQQHSLPEPGSTAPPVASNANESNSGQDFDEDRNGRKRAPSSQREGADQESYSLPGPQETGNQDLPSEKTVGGEIEKPKASQPAKLFLRFAEMPREFLAQIFSDSQIILESQQIQVVRYPTNQTIEEVLKKILEISSCQEKKTLYFWKDACK
ncbi:MAG: zinc ribbon domain-containing protein [Bdellovibrionales bacterium]|nr:zinc ribbon domain-containing protein [Bdellovibrionales bacterium]